MTEEEFFNKSTQATNLLIAMANEVIIKESPVSYNTIANRIKEACGITKGGAKVNDRIDYVVRATRVKPAPDGGTLFFWRSGDNPLAFDFYRFPTTPEDVRQPQDIHPAEAACAMLEAIVDEYGMPVESAYVAGARKLGLTRMTPAVKDLMERGFDILQNENAVTKDSSGMLQGNNMV